MRAFLKKILARYQEKPIRLLMVVGSLAGGWILSHVLQSLTDSALWMPREWRIALEFVTALFCSAVSILVSELFAEYQARKRAPLSSEGYRQEAELPHGKSFPVDILLAGIFAVLAGVLLYSTVSLRNKCIYNLTATEEWWSQQFGPSKGVSEPSNRNEKDYPIPDFLNREKNTIFLPETFDVEMGTYLERIGDGSLRRGLQVALDKEPMKLVDWARANGVNYRENYTRRFLWRHFAIVFSIAVAYGLLCRKAEVLMDFVLHFVPH